jgi:hypothetical protein
MLRSQFKEYPLSWRRYLVFKSQDISSTFTEVLDGTLVPTALNHVVRLNTTGHSVILPSFPECFPRRFLYGVESGGTGYSVIVTVLI